jgi:hypothetical protein
MNATLIQAGLWLVAGAILLMFLSRRRRRKAAR